MKRLSLQWRIALLTALFIAGSCVILNLLIYNSGAYSYRTLDKYVSSYDESDLPIRENSGINGNNVIIDMTHEEFDAFYEDFTAELAQAEYRFKHISWIITILVSLLCGAIAFVISGRLLSPLREFSRQTSHIEPGNLDEIKLDEYTIPEFRELSRSINEMLTRLNNAFSAQKQFTGNAAHELRTPLALMQAKLDLYREQHREEESEAMETVKILSEQTDRLSHLVKTLLDMSDLENISRDDAIHLTPLIEEILADLSPLAEQKQIQLDQMGNDVLMTGSDVLIYRMIYNLVENGIKYNRPAGRVFVSVEQSADAGSVDICVSDSGTGIPREHLDSVFQPFFRSDKARSRSMGGVGLGLTLVREIARIHGGSVIVEVTSEEGTTFKITLPIEPA